MNTCGVYEHFRLPCCEKRLEGMLFLLKHVHDRKRTAQGAHDHSRDRVDAD